MGNIYITILGLLAGAICTASFLPQIIKSWRTHQTKDLSLAMLLAFVVGLILWTIYGILLNALPIILANAICLVLIFTLIFLKVKHG